MPHNPQASIIMYAATWCADCRRSKRFLDENNIDYNLIDIDQNPQAAAKVEEINSGNRSIPTLVFPDGSHLTEPNNLELGAKVGIN